MILLQNSKEKSRNGGHILVISYFTSFNFVKNVLHCICFPVNFQKIFGAIFYKTSLGDCFWKTFSKLSTLWTNDFLIRYKSCYERVCIFTEKEQRFLYLRFAHFFPNLHSLIFFKFFDVYQGLFKRRLSKESFDSLIVFNQSHFYNLPWL